MKQTKTKELKKNDSNNEKKHAACSLPKKERGHYASPMVLIPLSECIPPLESAAPPKVRVSSSKRQAPDYAAAMEKSDQTIEQPKRKSPEKKRGRKPRRVEAPRNSFGFKRHQRVERVQWRRPYQLAKYCCTFIPRYPWHHYGACVSFH